MSSRRRSRKPRAPKLTQELSSTEYAEAVYERSIGAPKPSAAVLDRWLKLAEKKASSESSANELIVPSTRILAKW